MRLQRELSALALAVVFLTTQSAAINLSQTPPMKKQTGRIEKSILQIERQLFSAIKTKDIMRLSKILADEFAYRGPGQPELERAEFLKSVASFPMQIVDIWSDDMKVNVYGDVAVLTGTQQARTRNSDGKEEMSASAFTDVFAKRRGRWCWSWPTTSNCLRQARNQPKR